MDYNELKLSIYESFNNGEIDEIEKDILLERLEERYNEEDNEEDITLEEAMDTISSYLYETTAQTRRSIQLNERYKKLNNKIDKLKEMRKKAESEKNTEKVADIDHKIEQIEDEIDEIIEKITIIDKHDISLYARKVGRRTSRFVAKAKENGPVEKSNFYDLIERNIERKKEEIKDNEFRGNSKRKERKPGMYKTTNGLKESVDELRLDVYESFNNGNITEEEKNMFLEYLDLDNYS